ncbi:hypothetical protein ALQ08_200125 [Pseudomonas syringae pv. delphinii]|jgi:hypothetical protein|uniref:Uncharacterized protein n=2 Tax=Pseudomonas TaxID=286 RepID=A0A6B7PWL0_PSEPU|nr:MULTISPECIES: hypothetical protein [Pseudomonas]MBA1203574.1 hypothetical protein [Pseudomonas capeferrum]QFX76586.1 hypothetical protein [Pseudomonas putida]RMQ20915.1 hypothetical protein ALQ08_200125 [Pseudomonas syringae pv. delphinii]
MISYPQHNQAQTRSLLISGLFPNGDPFAGEVQADSSYEAQIKALAQCRYSDLGGDLDVTGLTDVATGASVLDSLLSAGQDLLSEVEAVEYVIHTVQNSLNNGRTFSAGSTSELSAYVEFFDLILSEAPHAFDGLCSGDRVADDEEITLDFEDSSSAEFALVPADALLTLATVALGEGRAAAAYQVLEMASITRVALSKACIRALV